MSKKRRPGSTNPKVGQTVTFPVGNHALTSLVNSAYSQLVFHSMGIQPSMSDEELQRLDEDLWNS